jgi:hypothetical protein
MILCCCTFMEEAAVQCRYVFCALLVPLDWVLMYCDICAVREMRYTPALRCASDFFVWRWEVL